MRWKEKREEDKKKRRKRSKREKRTINFEKSSVKN
jgi:hypothetical protein